MNQKTKTFIKSILLVVGFAATISAMAVWTGPTGIPPSNNIEAPINASRSAQSKDGALVVAAFRSTGLGLFDDKVEIKGSVSVGMPGAREATTSPSALIELNSTTQGFLPPRMTLAQRNAISSPSAGLMIYQTDSVAGPYYFNGVVWMGFGAGKSGTGDTSLP